MRSENNLIRTFIILSFFIFTIPILLTSCDPMKNVLIKNYTQENIRIRIQQDTMNLLSLGPNSEFEYRLTASGDSSETRLFYEIGMFSKEELNSFNAMIKYISIETEFDSCLIKGTDLIQYLPKKRLGIHNNTLEIKIKKCP